MQSSVLHGSMLRCCPAAVVARPKVFLQPALRTGFAGEATHSSAGSRLVVAHASSQPRKPKKHFSEILIDFIYPESEIKKGNFHGWRWKAMMVCWYLLVGWAFYQFSGHLPYLFE